MRGKSSRRAGVAGLLDVMRYDAIIIGAGHNGLTTACYLAKAGHRVLVLERRPIVGGAVCTEEGLIPGYKIDVGSSAHIMIHLTPVLRDLELETRHGLEYLEMDPFAFYPLPDSDQHLCFYRDLDRTCASIARISARDAEAYRRFVAFWGMINEGVFEVFLKPPTPGKLFGTMFKRNAFNRRSRAAFSQMDTVRQLMTSYGQLIRETFESEPMRAAMTWLAAQSGPPPNELASGDFFGWHAMLHKSGAKRAKGGSGALTQAMARCLKAHGGEILTDAEVSRIELENGRAVAVHVNGQRLEARAIIAACHVQTTFLKLIGAENLPGDLMKRVGNIRVGNGFGMIVRHAVSELPRYAGMSHDARGVSEAHSSLQLLCPSCDYLDAAYHDYLAFRPPARPAVLAMTFSALDPTLAPPGKHTLFTWAQYHPYELRNGEQWDDIAGREADKLYEVVCRYAPNMRGKCEGRFIQTPLDLERRLGLLRGNVMHVEMSFDQMFCFRPLPELSAYTTPVENLFLTGASTHPGGGVFGASGYNCAQVVLKKLR
jgi:phytoene dehydrogenase-like protein